MNTRKKYTIHLPTLWVFVITISLTLIVILSVLMSGHGNANHKPKQSISFPDVPAVPDNGVEYILDYTLDHIVDSYSEGETEFVNSTASFPVFSGGEKEATDQINSYLMSFISDLSSIKDQDVLNAKDDLNWLQAQELPFYPYDFTVSTDSILQKNGYLSVKIEYTRSTGLGDPSQKIYTFCFNVKTGEIADLSDFINSDKDFALSFIKTVIEQDIDINPELYYSNAKDILNSELFLDNFYLTDNCAVIYLEPEIITPRVYGIVEIQIPYSKIGY